MDNIVAPKYNFIKIAICIERTLLDFFLSFNLTFKSLLTIAKYMSKSCAVVSTFNTINFV